MSTGMRDRKCRKSGYQPVRDARTGGLPSPGMNSVSTRRLVAVIAAALTVSGALVYWQGNEISGGILLRSGLVLGAIWLAWPALVKLNPRWLVPAVALLAFAVTRPSLLIWILPALLVFALLRRPQIKK